MNNKIQKHRQTVAKECRSRYAARRTSPKITSEEIARQTQEFLAAKGTVTKLPTGATTNPVEYETRFRTTGQPYLARKGEPNVQPSHNP